MRAAARDITDSVRAWLAGLDEAQRTAATFPFVTPERFNWSYLPGPRQGLPIGDMRPEQRAACAAVVASAMSERTAGEVGAIMSLETVLGELERGAGRQGWMRRDPDRYWFSIFGSPGQAAPWSLRIEGHHVSIHLAVAGDRVIGVTPSFLGANPALVPSGPLAGTRLLRGEEELARALLSELTSSERRAAVAGDVAPADILTGTDRLAVLRSVPVGIRHAALGTARQAALERLIRHYLSRLRSELEAVAWSRIVDAGLGDVTFAWAGPDAPGRGHYYAVRGPTFVIEYDNTQSGANHVHAVWRDLGNDWGDDMLAGHLGAAHSMPGSAKRS
jgi:hypothetical protein